MKVLVLLIVLGCAHDAIAQEPVASFAELSTVVNRGAVVVGGGIGYAIDGAIDGETLVFRRPSLSMSVKF